MQMNKYFIYCRKSSEQEDRQVLSLDSQEKELTRLVETEHLTVIDIYKESGSAHVIGRKLFNEMLKRIENGEASGLVVWDESRIARNSMDGGKVIYMMDLGQIVEIIKPNKIYRNTPDDKSWLAMVFMMSKKESDDKGVNSKRGMRTKAEQGWYPAHAVVGFLNTIERKKGFKIIVKDMERFPLVRRIFDEVLTGKQASQVYKEAVEVWKLTTTNGRPLARSTFYNILNNPFYFGEFEWEGEWYKGKHEPMITREEFDTVQKMLGKSGKPIEHSHTFDLTGLLRCKKCGFAITATKKVKYYKKTGRMATYIFYHCSKKNKQIKCDAKPLTEADLVAQIDARLLQVKPEIEFITWAKKWLAFIHKDHAEMQEEVLTSQQRALEGVESRLNRLLDMRLNDVLDDNAYKTKKAELENQKRELNKILVNTGSTSDSWRTKVESALDFAYACQQRFNNGTREEKHEVLMRLGENLFITNHKLLDITLKKEYETLADKENWETRYKNWREPVEYTDLLERNPDLRPASPLWLPRVDSNH
ncbi:MAG: recombinase family protein [Patescibacteria group bacterium]